MLWRGRTAETSVPTGIWRAATCSAIQRTTPCRLPYRQRCYLWRWSWTASVLNVRIPEVRV